MVLASNDPYSKLAPMACHLAETADFYYDTAYAAMLNEVLLHYYYYLQDDR